MGKEIQHWTIKITWDDKTEEYLSDMPNYVADAVDEFLTDIENDKRLEEECCSDTPNSVLEDTTVKHCPKCNKNIIKCYCEMD